MKQVKLSRAALKPNIMSILSRQSFFTFGTLFFTEAFISFLHKEIKIALDGLSGSTSQFNLGLLKTKFRDYGF